jgi:3-oxoacyl-[acyl-carrier protein] reductase
MISLNLSGKTALIGGSTQGIGWASACQLASMGATCVLVARNRERLTLAVQKLKAINDLPHSFLVADYSRPDEVKEIIGAFAANHTVHIVVNNTGGPVGGPITNAQPEAFLQAFNQHLICNHIISQLLVPGMKAANWGRIINVISTSVKIPLKDLGVSNTIRAAVAGWAKTMANELGAFGITVNNVLPGATATERLETIIKNKVANSGNALHEVENHMLAEIPAGRFGHPEEIAAMVAFLASPAAAYVNGTSIPVDGGRTGSI